MTHMCLLLMEKTAAAALSESTRTSYWQVTLGVSGLIICVPMPVITQMGGSILTTRRRTAGCERVVATRHRQHLYGQIPDRVVGVSGCSIWLWHCHNEDVCLIDLTIQNPGIPSPTAL